MIFKEKMLERGNLSKVPALKAPKVPHRAGRHLRIGGMSKTEPPPADSPAPLLSERQKRHLRGLAHALEPIVRLGNAGLTAGVASETAAALHHHELIKVKAPGGNREGRDALFNALADQTRSALVHRIGNVAVLYRPRPGTPKILIPDA